MNLNETELLKIILNLHLRGQLNLQDDEVKTITEGLEEDSEVNILNLKSIKDFIKEHANWKILRFENQEDYEKHKQYTNKEAIKIFGVKQETNFSPNLLLNNGITVLCQLLGGITANAYSNANARIGVGDSSTAAAATQTGLQAATNKTYVAMDTGFPSVSAQTITFQATFSGSVANYSWVEFCVDNGASGTTLNRKVDTNQGTKMVNQVWVIQLQFTFS